MNMTFHFLILTTKHDSFQIHGVTTIALMYMPAFLPACAMFKEVGCYTIDGDIVNSIMIDSPDGLIEIQHTDGCCNEYLMTGVEQNMSIEIKSPYPDPMQMPLHYNIPRGYVIQILSHMKVTGTETNLYVSVGSNSVCIIECTFHEELWNDTKIGQIHRTFYIPQM